MASNPNKKGSHITTLIIHHCHKRVHHHGRYLTHGDNHSEGFHIVSGKRVIQKHINACTLCRRLHQRLQGQIIADLPPDRQDPAPLFTNVGLEVFGGFKVKCCKATRSHGTERKSGLCSLPISPVMLFTCS